MADIETLSETPGTDEARDLLVSARVAFRDGDEHAASKAFEAAASSFTGPRTLLGGALAWRGLAEVATAQSRWSDAVAALDQAERLFDVARGQEEVVGRPKVLTDAIRRGFAACRLVRSDVFLRQGQLFQARVVLNETVQLYVGLQPRTELWRLCARLAEHEGRWGASRMAWRRVRRSCQETEDAAGEADAGIRLTEVLLTLAKVDEAEDALEKAELAARRTMNATLLGRVRMAHASLAEGQEQHELAFELWERALEGLAHADSNLKGLARVRMALLAARVRPLEVPFLLNEGLRMLLEVPHPDAVGLVHHQLAKAALLMGKPEVAVLAAAGAERARGCGHPATQVLLVEAFERLYRPMAFDDLARMEGLMEQDLGTRRGVLHLCDRLTERGPGQPFPRRSKSPKFVWQEGDGVHEETVPDGVLTMGSVEDADVLLPTQDGVRLSIRSDAAGVRIQVDPQSPLPVLLDGHPVRGEHFLTDGDVLTLGDFELTHVVPAPTRSFPSAPGRQYQPPEVEELPPQQEDSEPQASFAGNAVQAYGLLFVVAVASTSAGIGIAFGAMLVLGLLSSIE